MNGLFLVIDGCEAAGKSTLIQAISDKIRNMGFEVVNTREPGGTVLGERLREMILSDTSDPLTPEVETMLLLTARKDHVDRVIKPALEKGQIVICDRYHYSTIAYQGIGKGVSKKFISDLAFASEIPTPDLSLLLDVPVTVTCERMAERGGASDRMERMGEEFFDSVRHSFLEQASVFEETRIIDASVSKEELVDSVMQVIGYHLPYRASSPKPR